MTVAPQHWFKCRLVIFMSNIIFKSSFSWPSYMRAISSFLSVKTGKLERFLYFELFLQNLDPKNGLSQSHTLPQKRAPGKSGPSTGAGSVNIAKAAHLIKVCTFSTNSSFVTYMFLLTDKHSHFILGLSYYHAMCNHLNAMSF